MYFRNKHSSAETNPVTDAELVRAARRGDKRAFVEIVARHQAMVCGVALAILGEFAASEDAAQEAFLTAWRKIQDLREPERLRAWLAQIARNAALGHRRRQRGHEELEEYPNFADQSPAPDEAAANEEEAVIVRDTLAKLPENYRLPLVLYYREGKSVQAVAQALDISEDATKQRLARGREMLRDQMSGLIESVLTRTGPTTVFTMVIATAIGALATPAAVAGTVFAASTAATSSTSLLTAMTTTSKTVLVTTAVLVTAVCIPVGYHVAKSREKNLTRDVSAHADIPTAKSAQKSPPSFENSALFKQWRELHDRYGTTAEAMPRIYDAITVLKDPFQRRAFRAALIAEWVQLDPANGLNFFAGRGRDTAQRKQFFEEWLERDPRAAVDALLANTGSVWDSLAKENLAEIARKVPSHIAEIAARLPAPRNDFWDTTVRDAFAIVAERGLASARTAAEAMTGPNRGQALAGVAQTWAKNDFTSTMDWIKTLPESLQHDGERHDEIVRAALLGRAAVDPAGALEQLGIVPPGGKEGYFATTTGARVLKGAAQNDFEGTVNWIAAHPGRLSRDDMMGIAQAVTDRINADPIGFLNTRTADGSLAAIIPAIDSAILNDAGAQRMKVWEWLKTQPDNDTTKALKTEVINASAWQDPETALRLAAEIPSTKDGEDQLHSLAQSLFNGGSMLHRFDRLYAEAPERLRGSLLEAAFNLLDNRNSTIDPQVWAARLPQLPEAARARGASSLANAWAQQSPEEAVNWAASLPAGSARTGAFSAVVSTWAMKDAPGTAQWISSMPAGTERDQNTASLVLAAAQKFPREAWNWALSIDDNSQRIAAATHAAAMMAARDPATAQQWIESAPFTPEVKAQMQSEVERTSKMVKSRLP